MQNNAAQKITYKIIHFLQDVYKLIFQNTLIKKFTRKVIMKLSSLLNLVYLILFVNLYFIHFTNCQRAQDTFRESERSCTYASNYIKLYESDLLSIHDSNSKFICNLPRHFSCCQPKVENRLASRALQSKTREIHRLATHLWNEFKKYDTILGAYTEVIEAARENFINVFKLTYGMHHYRHTLAADHIYDYLKDFPSHLDISSIPAELYIFFSSIFTSSTLDIFNIQDASPTYQLCIRQVYRYFSHLVDYSEVYYNMSSFLDQLKIILETRQSLYQLVFRIKNRPYLLLQENCLNPLMKMSHCQLCGGYNKLESCADFCTNTIQGCLASTVRLLEPLEYQFNLLTELISRNSNRLSEIPNMFRTLSDLGIKFVVQLRLNGKSIVRKSKTICAIENISKRSLKQESNNEDNNELLYRRDLPTSLQSGSTRLATAKEDFILAYGKVISFIKSLPYNLCGTNNAENINCWDGEKLGNYTKGIVGTNREDQVNNPEIELSNNAFQYLQEDYNLIRDNTYKIHDYFRIKACYKDHPKCISQLNICENVHAGSNPDIDSTNSFEGSGQGVPSQGSGDNEFWRSNLMHNIAGGYADTETVDDGEVLSSGDIYTIPYIRSNSNTKNIIKCVQNATKILAICRPRNFISQTTTITADTTKNNKNNNINNNNTNNANNNKDTIINNLISTTTSMPTNPAYNFNWLFSSSISIGNNVLITILIMIILLMFI